jgi:hypothetical protein
MMMFIPIEVLYKSSNDFRTKIQFNHDKYLGDETLFLHRRVPESQQHYSIKKWKINLHSSFIEEHSSICRPQLFQQAEPNPAAVVTIVTFQAQER